MNRREQKGLEIAALSKIKRKGKAWLVPSQSGKGEYIVRLDSDPPTCTCKDYKFQPIECKHIYGATFARQREQGITVPRQITILAGKAKAKYKQNWPAYNLAQTEEKTRFQILLHDLCHLIREPIQVSGRPRLPLADMIFGAAFKVYSTISCRRFMSDLKAACEKGYISKVPCHNSVYNYFESIELSPYLYHLIVQSAIPLKTVETKFAVDASGFRTRGYVRWFNTRYGAEQKNHDWLKIHLTTGVKTNIVSGVEISDRYAHDSPFFEPLVKATSENFTIEEVSADKGYSSRHNLRLVNELKAIPYIAFKENARESNECEVWDKIFHYFCLHKREYFDHYHKRSNVESTFWMIKSKFGEQIRSKLPAAQINEALCKILCHNICCVIQSTCELGIEAAFWPKESLAQKIE